MLHLFTCRSTLPLWRKCINFCRSTLGTNNPPDITRAIIFGQETRTTLLPEIALAFLRHASGRFYDDFSKVALQDRKFIWEDTFYHALLNFRSAAIRYARQIKVLGASRLYSTLEGITPLEARTKYAAIIEIDQDGHWTLSDNFTRALTAAETDAKRAVDAASH